MTSSAVPAAAASSHQQAPRLHITTTTTGTGTSTITTSPSSHHHHSPSSARSAPHSASSSPRGSSSNSGTAAGGGGGSGSTNQACAACKYQRRKCNQDCPLAPYFPADQQRRFLNAHRLFGVSNILKTLKRLRPELCADAMGTLIYQSDMRATDPVGGCYRLILSLERQLEIETAELSAVLHNLALYRQAAAAAAAAIPPQEAGGAMAADLDVTSSNQPLLLDAEQEVVDALYANHEADTAAILQTDGVHRHDHGDDSPQDHGEQQQQQQQLFDYFYYEATASDDASSKPTIDINLDNMQQFDFDDTCAAEKIDLAPAGPEEMGQPQHLDVNCQIDHKDYQIKAAALVDAFDMRQELQPAVDVNADVVVKAVDMNAGIGGVGIKAVDVNANVDVNVDLQEEDPNNIAAGDEAVQMAAESSHCRLGLGFSSF
ncbi:hypothetical protein SETIT_6G138500v2 [Setaria italica]|uniref:LOB domain-containing protein n=1 Tax=Setaria italica TaxID=4555 RepID=K3YNE2_SETIT|nr:uncharacterized protein LOC101782058 [Setaria italica]RCV30967.1 hypothetical protein SETIT_6G138500v2 [Setaria italica]